MGHTIKRRLLRHSSRIAPVLGASTGPYIILQVNFYDGPPAAILECVNKGYLDLNAPAVQPDSTMLRQSWLHQKANWPVAVRNRDANRKPNRRPSRRNQSPIFLNSCEHFYLEFSWAVMPIFLHTLLFHRKIHVIVKHFYHSGILKYTHAHAF